MAEMLIRSKSAVKSSPRAGGASNEPPFTGGPLRSIPEGHPKNYSFQSRRRPYTLVMSPCASWARPFGDGTKMMHYVVILCFSAVLFVPGFYALRGTAWTGRILFVSRLLFRFVRRRLLIFGIDAARFTVSSLNKVEEIPAKILNESSK